jgi:hypothetical protein
VTLNVIHCNDLTVTMLRTYKAAAVLSVLYPGIFFRVGGSTNSVEDRGQRERGSGGGSLLVRDSGGS